MYGIPEYSRGTDPSAANISICHTALEEIFHQLLRTLSTEIHYLEEKQGTARYLLATSSSNFAAPIIVETGRAVMAIGGYSGADRILTRAELVALVRAGVVRFFLLSSPRRTIHSASLRIRQERAARLSLTGGTTSWIASVCHAISPTTWQGIVAGRTQRLSASLALYDCAGVF